jgi:hypothetical protein
MEKTKINKPSYSWQKEAETYFNNTPHPKQWFEFLGWITALSTLNFLSQKTGSIYIKILYGVSLLVLYNYIQKILWTKRFQDYLPKFISGRIRTIITYSISAIAVAIAYILGQKIVEDVVKGLKL